MSSPGSGTGRAWWAVTAMLLVGLGLITAAWLAHERHGQMLLGQALFDGLAPEPDRRLTGRIAGHDRALPAEAARCVNCHTGAAGPTGFGPPLHAGTLAQPLARRGGPPSIYEEASLCRLLREGIDPAWVMVNQAMPRYDATDAQCAALWAWLVRQTGARASPAAPLATLNHSGHGVLHVPA